MTRDTRVYDRWIVDYPADRDLAEKKGDDKGDEKGDATVVASPFSIVPFIEATADG